MDCPNEARNARACKCTYTSCDKRGKCCECLRSHLEKRELPGCCFPADVEKTYDRSFDAFIRAWAK